MSTAPGHAGRFVFGYVDNTRVVCMQGRVHMYEGYDPKDVVLPVRLMGAMGARIFFVTNACGGIRPDLDAGKLMLITDQISCFVPNPLRGENVAELGVRFPAMTAVYDRELRDIVRAAAEKSGVELKEGVYVQLPGPSFETPAEVRLLGRMGGGAVGMSTACEAVAARHMGLRVCGISCITNKGAGISQHVLTHEEVVEAGNLIGERFSALVTAVIPEIYAL